MFFFQVFHFLSPSLFLSAAFSFGRFICLSFFHHHPPPPPHHHPRSFFLCSTSLCLCLCHFLYLVLVCWVSVMCSGHTMATASASNHPRDLPTIPHAKMSKCPDTERTGRGGGDYTADSNTSSAVSLKLEKMSNWEDRGWRRKGKEGGLQGGWNK